MPSGEDVKLEEKPSLSNLYAEQDKNILVSLVLTQSGTSTLRLDIPYLEDQQGSVSPTVCTLKSSSIKEKPSKTVGPLTSLIKSWYEDSAKDSTCDDVESEVAFFRSDNFSVTSEESMSSVEDFEDEFKGEFPTQLLKPKKVYMRPLYAVCTQAHRNLVASKNNDIYISLVNKANITDTGWVNFCRICHGGESTGDLLAPCKCKGSIALTHLECLERWLKESSSSKCELCQHHFHIIREPKYSILKSVFVFLRHPGEHLSEILFDLFAFIIYTPAAVASTYMLMLLCDSIAKHPCRGYRAVTCHLMSLAAVCGMAAIDFTYSSWFMANMHKHIAAWRYWYHQNSNVKIILPPESKQSSLIQTIEYADEDLD